MRFSFNDEYSQVLVGDYIIQKGKRAKEAELKYTAYSINNQTGFSVQQEQWGDASYTKLEKNGYKVIEHNDFAYNPARINVGSIGLYKEKNPCIVSSLYVCFATKSKLNPDYLFKYLKSDKFNKKVLSTQEGGVRTYFFYDKLQKTKIYIPSLPEQYKINEFLDLINSRIETQNKIIEKYESLKIGIKESIYLLSKEKEPLEKILHEVSEKSTTQNQYPVLSSTVKGLFLQNEYFDRSIASDNNIGYKIVHKGQIIISPQNLWMGNLTFNDKYENGIVSPSYKIYDIDQKYSKKYIYWLLTSKRSFFNYGLVSEQGASIVRRNLSIDAFMGLSIPVVKDRNCESKIEKLIDLIEKKLETEKKRGSLLNQQKQFLLSNLFI